MHMRRVSVGAHRGRPQGLRLDVSVAALACLEGSDLMQSGAISDDKARAAVLDALNGSALTGLTSRLVDANLLLLCRVFKPKKDDIRSVTRGLIRGADAKLRFIALTSDEDARKAEDGQLFYVYFSGGQFVIKNHWSMGELLGIETEHPPAGGHGDDGAPHPVTLILGGEQHTFMLPTAGIRDEVIVNLLQTCELLFSHSVVTAGVDVGALMSKAQVYLRKNPVLMARLGLGRGEPKLGGKGGEDAHGAKKKAHGRGSNLHEDFSGVAEEERAAAALLNSYDWRQQHVPDVEKALSAKLEELEYDTVKFLLAWEPRKEEDDDYLRERGQATAASEASTEAPPPRRHGRRRTSVRRGPDNYPRP
mmetsp:Transcript_12677/g.38010  ORF Transcript_12677/g.38010 Transcript_12677/m.38010 type:complete len:363 (-) Transcript_12677:1553-2641(-)